MLRQVLVGGFVSFSPTAKVSRAAGEPGSAVGAALNASALLLLSFRGARICQGASRM